MKTLKTKHYLCREICNEICAIDYRTSVAVLQSDMVPKEDKIMFLTKLN